LKVAKYIETDRGVGRDILGNATYRERHESIVYFGDTEKAVELYMKDNE